MSHDQIKKVIVEIQQLFSAIAYKESNEDRDFEADIIQIQEFSLKIHTAFKEDVNLEDIEFIQECLDIFINEYLKYIAYPIERVGEILDCIIDIIYPCLMSLGTNFNSIQADTIILMIINYFQQIYDVNSCGLDALGCLSTCLQSKFTKYLDVIWPYAVKAMNKQETNVLRSALGMIVEISISSGRAFSSKLPILNQLFSLLENENCNQEIKPDVFSAIGDIVLSTEDLATPYLTKLIQVYKTTFSKISEQIKTNIENIKELDKLQFKVIESFSCINITFKRNPQILNVLEEFSQFLKQTCKKSLNPSASFLQQCLGVVSDLIHFNQEKLFTSKKNNSLWILLNN